MLGRGGTFAKIVGWRTRITERIETFVAHHG
jgi:hypothetical protein